MLVNFYYSDALTSDTEGNLVQLCRSCARLHADEVQWASKGHDQSECEIEGCTASNDPAYSTDLDKLIARLTNR